MTIKKVAKKPAKKDTKKSVSTKKTKKSVVKKSSPLNSKGQLEELKKLYSKLGRLNGERAELLDAIARKEAAMGEILDMNLAKFDESSIGLTLGASRTPETPSPCPGISIPLVGSSDLLPNAVAYRH